MADLTLEQQLEEQKKKRQALLGKTSPDQLDQYSSEYEDLPTQTNDIKQAYEKQSSNRDWAELADKVAQGLVRYGAATAGAKKGVEIGALKPDLYDYNSARDRDLKKYATDLGDVKERDKTLAGLIASGAKQKEPIDSLQAAQHVVNADNGKPVYLQKGKPGYYDENMQPVANTKPFEPQQKDYSKRTVQVGDKVFSYDPNKDSMKEMDLAQNEVAPGVKLNPKEEQKLQKVTNDFNKDPEIKQMKAANRIAQQAKNALVQSDTNPVSYSTFQGLMSQLAQGGGQRLTDQDIKQFGSGSQAILDQADQYIQKKGDGTITIQNKAYFNKLIDSLQKGNQQLYNDRAAELAQQQSKVFTPFRGKPEVLQGILTGQDSSSKQADKGPAQPGARKAVTADELP